MWKIVSVELHFMLRMNIASVGFTILTEKHNLSLVSSFFLVFMFPFNVLQLKNI